MHYTYSCLLFKAFPCNTCFAVRDVSVRASGQHFIYDALSIYLVFEISHDIRHKKVLDCVLYAFLFLLNCRLCALCINAVGLPQIL